MATIPNHRTPRYLRYVLIALGVILAVLVVLAVINYRTLRHEQLINAREFLISSIVKNHGPLMASDATIIQAWMTFDYINKIFNLPADYLKTKLVIADPRYPQLSLGGYARGEHLATNTFVGSVQNAVREYFTTQ